MIEELKAAVVFFERVSFLIEGLTWEIFGPYLEGHPDVTEQAWKRGFGDSLPGL